MILHSSKSSQQCVICTT